MKSLVQALGFNFRLATITLIMSGALGVPTSTLGQDWWLEGGPVVRGGMTIKVTGMSYVQSLGRHAAAGPLSEHPNVGNRNAYADRTYADGYVRLDPGTQNPNAVGGMGRTWNWAYDRAGQYNSSANTLTLYQQGDPGYTTLLDRPVSGRDDMLGAGIQIQAGFPIAKSDKWTIHFGFGFQGAWGAESRLSMTSYRERISQLNVTDTYNVADALHPTYGFPPPRTLPGGYVGTYEGPAGGPSSWVGGYPLIGNLPAARETAQQDLSTAYNQTDFHFETDFYELALSPRIQYAATKALSFHLTPKLGVAYIDVTASRNEVFSESTIGGGTAILARWQDSGGGSAFRFVAGLSGGVDLALGKGYSIGVFGGYEWVVDDVRFTLGPNTVAMDASGFTAGMALRKQF